MVTLRHEAPQSVVSSRKCKRSARKIVALTDKKGIASLTRVVRLLRVSCLSRRERGRTGWFYGYDPGTKHRDPQSTSVYKRKSVD